MTEMTAIHPIPRTVHSRVPPDDLPARPDDIDLDRIVTDPEYRRAVQDLLRQWGICDDKGGDKGRQTAEKRSRVAGLP